MVRALPWRPRCPPVVEERLTSIGGNDPAAAFFVVQQPGPTSFVLKDVMGGSQRKFKVKVGDKQECSCNESRAELCVHILFVMARVFRVPVSNPLIWQRALMEAEVEQIVFGGVREGRQNAARAAAAAAAAARDGSTGETPVDRKPVEDGDSCPICCDDLDPAGDMRQLVHCRYGCGNNIHATCFTAYAKHNASSPTPLQCPLCRGKWGALNGPDQQLHGVSCASCKVPISGERYRCAFCVSYSLCSKCFGDSSNHAHHPFDVSSAPGQPFRHVDRQGPAPRGGAAGGAAAGGVDPAHLGLMNRSLGPEDYDALLRLDDGVAPSEGTTLTDAQVALLQRVHWSAAEDYEECAICMDRFQTGDNCIKLGASCGHIYHSACAARWFTESRAACPIDNVPVVVPTAPLTRAAAGSREAADPRAAPAVARPRDPTGVRPGPRAGASGVADRRPRGALQRRSSSTAAPSAGAMHRFAEVAHGRAPLARTGNVTEGSFRPTQNDLAGLSLGVTGIGAGPGVGGGAPEPQTHARALPRGASTGGSNSAPAPQRPSLPGPVLPARVSRLRTQMRS